MFSFGPSYFPTPLISFLSFSPKSQEPREKKHQGHHTLQDHAPHTAFLPHGDLDGCSVLNTSRDASDTLMGESVGIWVCFSTVTGTFVGHFMQEIKASFLCTPWALDLTLCLAFSKCQDIATFYTFVKFRIGEHLVAWSSSLYIWGKSHNVISLLGNINKIEFTWFLDLAIPRLIISKTYLCLFQMHRHVRQSCYCSCA